MVGIVLTEGDIFLESDVDIFRQRFLFLHAADDFLFELRELADFFRERVFDIFFAQEVETVDAEHLTGRPVGVVTQMIVDTSRFRRAGSAEEGAADARLPRNATTFSL